MKKNEWIKKHIKILTNNPTAEDLSQLFEEKINYINKPFYKYCSIPQENNSVNRNIENLKNNILFFQNPKNFNDPFDCFLGISVNSIIKNEVIKNLKQKNKYISKTKPLIENLFYIPNDSDIDRLIINKNFINKSINNFLKHKIQNEKEREFLLTIFNELFMNDNNSLKFFVKFINNQLTIRDKQYLLNKLFENQNVTNYIKKHTHINDYDIKMRKSILIQEIENGKNVNLFLNDRKYMSTSTIIELLSTIHTFYPNTLQEINPLEIKNEVTNTLQDNLLKIKKIISENFKITCLSERLDSPLMWAHYTDKHRGFCLEYDFTHSNLSNIQKKYPDYLLNRLLFFPVQYSKKRPQITRTLSNNITRDDKKTSHISLSNLLQCLLIKSEEWRYEKEWRLIKMGNVSPISKFPNPSKIFLGCNINEHNKKLLIEIAKEKNIPIFQMRLEPDEYKFSYYQLKV